MRVSKVHLTNIRGYENAKIEMSESINLIVGENNSGKTTILKTILFLQDRSVLSHLDIRKNELDARIEIDFTGELKKYLNMKYVMQNKQIAYVFLPDRLVLDTESGEFNYYEMPGSSIDNKEPTNFIYPFLSKRKVALFNEDIRQDSANSVLGNFQHLFAKVDRITTDGLPAKEEYIKACDEILGFRISSFTAANGKKASYIIDNFKNISIESMGEGVANILALILDLCMAEDKLFLIEEPENDIHPKALKKLLQFILEKSKTNQFIITTHSNIVLKYLGCDDKSKIFNVTLDWINKLPTSTIVEIDNSIESRRLILENLGYELLDFDVWDTWLILEESSAETIIKEILIPNFAPKLKDRIKICSTTGVDRVPQRVEALHSLCLYFHLQKTFNDRIWVVVDAGENETEIINQLKNGYKTWSQNRFQQFKEHDFEKYYPEQFQEEFNAINEHDKKKKSAKKQKLLKKVMNWYTANPGDATEAFKKSAIDVIDKLREIEKNI